MEGFEVGEELPIVDMEGSFIIADKHPLLLNHLASGEFGAFINLLHFLA